MQRCKVLHYHARHEGKLDGLPAAEYLEDFCQRGLKQGSKISGFYSQLSIYRHIGLNVYHRLVPAPWL